MNAAAQILAMVCRAHGVHQTRVLGRCRERRLVMARHAAMLIIRETLGWSYPEIARFFHRDHSSVVAAIHKLESLTSEAPGGIYP